MKQCTECDQIVSEKILTCPACGSHFVEGMTHIDDYKILAIIHEGRSSIVCKAIKEDASHPVSIRIFTEKSGVDEKTAQRLAQELVELKKLPPRHFVQHYALRQTRDGHWYRLSEWVNAMDWGSVFMSGLLNDQKDVVTLFHNIASVLDLLHKQDHFMPYLILEDILIPKDRAEKRHVKINYKLSRFLNARATHHGPMLQKLLDCHPDIINKRAIDFKSAIWSLGKVFVEILSADPNLRQFSSKIDEMQGIDPELAVLIKLMLSEDPDLRPQSMGRVVSALAKILDRLPYQQDAPEKTNLSSFLVKELIWFKRVVLVLICLIIGIVGFGGVSWIKINAGMKTRTASLEQFVESYAGSVAFLMVEYRLKNDSSILYKNHVEGTAFLADTDGYILTNRHVACPWLDDAMLFQIYNHATQEGKTVEFSYDIHLWFEGAKAFNKLLSLRHSKETSDIYNLASAYNSGGPGNIRIVGIPRAPVKTGQLIKSPFRNDFAVLKIDNLPSDLIPLPLEKSINPVDIKRLSPVVILGFPLGNKTQVDHINTSITQGHVRRTTKELIQVDTSIYSGNSGGPAIDSDGRVIGIASGVVTDSTKGFIKIDTPLSDFGLVLPIYRPAALIQSIKDGRPQWNGVIDFSLDTKLETINALIIENKFQKATALSEKMLKTSNDPSLIYVTGLLNFCTSDLDRANFLFKKLAQIEPENTYARLMLFIIDWIRDDHHNRSFTNTLFETNWQNDNEFLGYLAQVLKTKKRYLQKLSNMKTVLRKAGAFSLTA
jgi:S1-C subfamily serine protease/RNA polymerase subunit RPABC4/transcription elongation factor Spt4